MAWARSATGLLKRASGLALPSGALGYWSAFDYTTTGRDRIPNALGTKASDGNLLSGSRRVFSAPDLNSGYWTPSNCSVVDCNVAAPDGSMEASTLRGLIRNFISRAQ